MTGSRSATGVTRRSWLQLMTGVAAGTAIGALAHGSLYQRTHLEVTRAELRPTGLPSGLDGLRIGLITDTHHSAFTSDSFIARAAALLEHERPDLVVLGGDYVTHRDRRYVAGGAEALGQLKAPHGVFGILGNHDDDVDVPRALRRRGVTMLQDARTRISLRGETLDLIGVRYWTRGVSEIRRAAQGRSGFSVLLAHDPRRLTEASSLGIPLVLSGHTHGGQIVLPLIGAPAARKFPVTEGTLVSGSTTLFVSRGVGTSGLPCRINCPPEVALLTLRATPDVRS